MSKAEYIVHSMHICTDKQGTQLCSFHSETRLTVCRGFGGVHSWKNATKCTDAIKCCGISLVGF